METRQPPEDPLRDLLTRFSAGDVAAGAAMVIALEDQLCAIARRVKGRQSPSVSMQTLDLVNEAMLKLMRRPPHLKDDRHFFGYVAETMKSVFTSYCRHRQVRRRAESVFLEAKVRECEQIMCRDFMSGEDLLQRLGAVNALGAQILNLQILCGQKQEVIAGVLGLSVATVQREGRKARQWIRKEANGD